MKKRRLLSLALTAILLIGLLPAPVSAAQNLDIVSKAAIVIDADSGQILYQKNAGARMYPASITKILTGLLVVEKCSLGEVLTVSQNATKLPSGYANIALRAGEQLVVDDAMYALMLASANDVANALGEHVSGSAASFAGLMNRRAGELGATSSNFVNASGVPSNYHYTTAHDMALITRAAYQNPTFMRYMTARDYTLPATNMRSTTLDINNHQLMMFEDEDYYNPHVLGGKIGYTNQAQHTMSTVATRNGRTFIVVVMSSTQRGKYTDTQALLDWAFATYADTVYVTNLFDFMN